MIDHFASCVDGDVYVDGCPADTWLTVHARASDRVFWDSTCQPTDIANLMNYHDRGHGNPDKLVAATFALERGVSRWYSLKGWGVKDEEGLAEMFELCEAHGINPKATSAATVRQMFPKTKALPPRWREPSHAAIWNGPQTHVSGGCEYGAHIDRSEAYLRAMRREMPVAHGWFILPKRTPLHRLLVTNKPCTIIHATVRVFHTPATNQMPPLPVHRRGGGTMYPVGWVRGIWPVEFLTQAADRGEIELSTMKVHWAMRCTQTTDEWMRLADRLAEFPKRLRKMLYTRIWGVLSSRNGYVGVPFRTRAGSFPSSGLRWVWAGEPQWSTKTRPWYRPDIAAFITGDNHASMLRATRRLPPESLIATHVDAIWTSAIDSAERIAKSSDWKMEGRGNIRYVAPGRYFVDGPNYRKVGHSGTVETPATVAQLVAECRGEGVKMRPQRLWLGDPMETQQATSVAVRLPMEWLARSPVYGLGPESDLWNGRGFMVDDEAERRQEMHDHKASTLYQPAACFHAVERIKTMARDERIADGDII